jgi:hypothetical protein
MITLEFSRVQDVIVLVQASRLSRFCGATLVGRGEPVATDTRRDGGPHFEYGVSAPPRSQLIVHHTRCCCTAARHPRVIDSANVCVCVC